MIKLKGLRMGASVVLSMAMILGTSIVSMASTYTDPIDDITLKISYSLEEDMDTDDVTVETNTEGIDSVTVTSIKDTDDGDTPTVTITIKADTDDDYYFDSDDEDELESSAAFTLIGQTVTYASSTRSSSSKLTLKITLPEIGSTTLVPQMQNNNQGWQQNANGNWNYINNNNQSIGWQQIDNKWYFFDNNGNMLENQWIQSGEDWYYLGSSGDMMTNATTPDGYRIGADGKWQK